MIITHFSTGGIRPINEDTIYASPQGSKYSLMIAASGRGGGTNGKRASEFLCQQLKEHILAFTEQLSSNRGKSFSPNVILNAFNSAQQALNNQSASSGLVMEARASLALIAGEQAWIGSVGDSVFYYKKDLASDVQAISSKEIAGQIGFLTDETDSHGGHLPIATVYPFSSQSFLVFGTGSYWKYLQQDQLNEIVLGEEEKTPAELLAIKALQSLCPENLSVFVVRGAHAANKQGEIDHLKNQVEQLQAANHEMSEQVKSLTAQKDQLAKEYENLIRALMDQRDQLSTDYGKLIQTYEKFLPAASFLANSLMNLVRKDPQVLNSDAIAFCKKCQKDIQSEMSKMNDLKKNRQNHQQG